MQNIMQITGTHLRGLPAAHWSFHAQVDLGGNLVSITCSSSIHQHYKQQIALLRQHQQEHQLTVY